MKHKMMLLTAMALSALAFAAVPAMAMASDNPPVSEAAGHTFSGTSTNTATLFGERNVVCKSEGGSKTITTHGEFLTDDTGWVEFTFHNCKENLLNSKCTTTPYKEGEEISSGTIKTTTLPFETVYLKPENLEKTHERPGILIKPGAETNEKSHFASFSCVGGFVKVLVGGNGILGTVEEPGIGEESNSMTINVSATAAGQEHDTTHTEGEGETYRLQQSLNGGATSPAYENAGSAEVSFAGGFEGKTTTETTKE